MRTDAGAVAFVIGTFVGVLGAGGSCRSVHAAATAAVAFVIGTDVAIGGTGRTGRRVGMRACSGSITLVIGTFVGIGSARGAGCHIHAART